VKVKSSIAISGAHGERCGYCRTPDRPGSSKG
jgi:hypothetical protein